MSLRNTQIGKEVWVKDPSNLRTTQIGKEVWEQTNNTSKLRVAQIGKEVWITTAGGTATSNVFPVQVVMPF
jgi:hypothetical protein